MFRPWGVQPGHQTEWAKLLLILQRHYPADWLLPTARHLFDTALDRAWDHEHGGICYGFAPDGTICDGDKYFWVQAESFAAAALLAVRTGDDRYWGWYDRIWNYSWRYMVDHQYGNALVPEPSAEPTPNHTATAAPTPPNALTPTRKTAPHQPHALRAPRPSHPSTPDRALPDTRPASPASPLIGTKPTRGSPPKQQVGLRAKC